MILKHTKIGDKYIVIDRDSLPEFDSCLINTNHACWHNFSEIELTNPRQLLELEERIRRNEIERKSSQDYKKELQNGYYRSSEWNFDVLAVTNPHEHLYRGSLRKLLGPPILIDGELRLPIDIVVSNLRPLSYMEENNYLKNRAELFTSPRVGNSLSGDIIRKLYKIIINEQYPPEGGP